MQIECRMLKTKFKGMKVDPLELDNPIFIKDTLCSYYKRLWSKCKDFGPINIYTLFWYQTVP